MKYYIFIFLCTFGLFQAQETPISTEINGTVVYETGISQIPLKGIKVYWKEHPSMETTTDENGHFQLSYHKGLQTLVAEFEGFQTTEITVNAVEPLLITMKFEDEGETALDEVVARSKIRSLQIDKSAMQLTYNITQDELLKAACCNLAESFETNPAVDVAYNDALTGTKEIVLLGLNQRYTSFTRNNVPEFNGLATYDGLEFIPGRWIQSLQLSKGTGAASNYYDAISGQINTELLSYNSQPETQLNFFLDSNLRTEFNATSTQSLNEKLTNAILLHGSSRYLKVDNNKDNFLDAPLSTQINIANVLQWNDLKNSGFNSIFGIQFLLLDKISGEKNYQPQRDYLSSQVYGVESNTQRLAVWNKTGKVFKKKGRSMGFINQFIYHDQDQTFGNNLYYGTESQFFSKLIYEDVLGDSENKFKSGISFKYDQFNESFYNEEYDRIERNLGLFAEYEMSFVEKLKLMLGTRFDVNNVAGNQLSPKFHLKYLPTSKTSLRITAGRSFRTASIFEENQKYFASQRNVTIINSEGGKIYGLKPEIAWNYGISLTQDFRLFHRKSNIVIDYFRTDFKDQVVADIDQPREIQFYNIGGKSVYHSFQTMVSTTLINNLEVRLAYKYYDTRIDYIHRILPAPFLPKHRGFLNLEYEIESKNNSQWKFDTTLQYVGKMRLPSTEQNPMAYQLGAYSKDYVTLNAQINRDFSDHFRMYVGAENILSYQQKNPIIEPENPFGTYFDASFSYAPIMPINFYLGLDLKF